MIKVYPEGWVCWYMPVNSATQEPEIEGLQFKATLGLSKIKLKQKGLRVRLSTCLARLMP
jgi:hypothetical protein